MIYDMMHQSFSGNRRMWPVLLMIATMTVCVGSVTAGKPVVIDMPAPPAPQASKTPTTSARQADTDQDATAETEVDIGVLAITRYSYGRSQPFNVYPAYESLLPVVGYRSFDGVYVPFTVRVLPHHAAGFHPFGFHRPILIHHGFSQFGFHHGFGW